MKYYFYKMVHILIGRVLYVVKLPSVISAIFNGPCSNRVYHSNTRRILWGVRNVRDNEPAGANLQCQQALEKDYFDASEISDNDDCSGLFVCSNQVMRKIIMCYHV